jgi:hypothetical protein
MNLENIKEIGHPQLLQNVKEGEEIVVIDEKQIKKSGYYAGIFQNSHGQELYLVGKNFNSHYSLFKFPLKENKIGTHHDSQVYAGMDKNIHDIVADIKTNQYMMEAEK